MTTKDDLLRACDEAAKAADAVLVHSVTWLACHPVSHWRLRRDLIAKRDTMRRTLTAWYAEGCR